MPFTTFRRKTPPWSGVLWLLATVPFLTGCSQEMANQPRYDTYESGSARPLPMGTVPHESGARQELLDPNAETFPFAITMEVLNRGQERYDIYCSPCHGYAGYGDGMVPRRGFRAQPTSFHTEAMRAASPGRFFAVITGGVGPMSPYGHQIEVTDRWAIAAYIRALQLSQSASVNDLAPDERQKLGAGAR